MKHWDGERRAQWEREGIERSRERERERERERVREKHRESKRV